MGALTTIVIPTWNRSALLDRCLSAVRATAPGTRVVVVDNGSEDATPEVMARHGVDVVRNEENDGFAVACNEGASRAETGLVCFLNNDTEPRGDWLDRLEAASAGGSHIVGPRLETPRGDLQCAGVDILPISFSVMRPGTRNIRTVRIPCLPREHREERASGFVDAVSGACLLIDRALFADLGGFDEGYRNGYEDMAFCMRATERGVRIWYEAEATIVHQVSGSGRERFRHNAENLKRLQAECLERYRASLA